MDMQGVGTTADQSQLTKPASPEVAIRGTHFVQNFYLILHDLNQLYE